MSGGGDGSATLAAAAAAPKTAATTKTKTTKTRRTLKKRKRPRGQWGYATATAGGGARGGAPTSAIGAGAAVSIAAAERPAAASMGAPSPAGGSLGRGKGDDHATNNTNGGGEGMPSADTDASAADTASATASASKSRADPQLADPPDRGTTAGGRMVPAAESDGDGRSNFKSKSKAKAKPKAKAKSAAAATSATMTDEEFAQMTGLAMTARNSTDVVAGHHAPPPSAKPAPSPSSSSSSSSSSDNGKIDDGDMMTMGPGCGPDRSSAAGCTTSTGGQQDEAADAKKPKSTAAPQPRPQPRRRPRWYEESSDDDDDDWEGWFRQGGGAGDKSGGNANNNANANANANANTNGQSKGGDEEKKKEEEEDDGDANNRKVAVAARKKRPTIRYDDIEDGIDREIVAMLEDEEFDAIAEEMKEREEAQRRAEREAREAREAKEREERESAEREERERKERKEADKRAKMELAERLRRDREARLARLRAAQSAAAAAAASAVATSAVARSASAAASNTTRTAPSSSSVAALHAANAAYNAIPAVTKPPAPTVPAPPPAPLPAAQQLHRSPSPSFQPSTTCTRIKSESSPRPNAGRGTGRLKDDRDYEDAPIKSDPADEGDVKPRIKSDPDKEEQKEMKGEAKPFVDPTSSPTAARTRPVDSSSYWAAVRIKQEEHTEWRQEVEERKENDNKKMYDTIEGKAFLFVERVLEKHKELSAGSAVTDSLISPVARDDMTFMAERMFQEQQNFWSAGKPVRVDIAYHYTQSQNMDRIRTDGLMTHAERQAASVTSNYNGSVYGDGVYTGNGPFAFRAYGDVGLIVARMKGVVERIEMGTARKDSNAGIDTVIGNKRPKGGYVMPTAFSRSVRRVMENEGEISDEEDENGDRYEDEVVLQKSSQVIPLIRYSAELLDPSQMESPGNEQLHTFHAALQIVIDDFFNEGRRTWVKDYFIPRYARPVPPPPQNFAFGPGSFTGTPIVPSGSFTRRRGGNPYSFTGGSAPFSGAGSRLGHYSSGTIAEIEYVAPYALDAPDCAYDEVKDAASSGTDEDVCSLCLDSFFGKEAGGKTVGKMKKCGHVFHRECIEKALTHNNKCPFCRIPLGQVRGQMPTGKMSVTKSSMKCKGYENCRGSLVITYEIQAAVQRIYMQNPGVKHSGKYETAYLPDNDEGRKLLERLKFAFSRGLTFVVGTSMTTGATNVVTWATIHHKTSPNNGPHGFPDPSYFANCNSELDNAGVPDFEECKKANGTKSDGEDDNSVIEIE